MKFPKLVHVLILIIRVKKSKIVIFTIEYNVYPEKT